MLLLELLAERRIREAQERGEFDALPGAGAPLALEDDGLVPEELRAAYRLLKNAGFVPPELEPLREAAALERLLARLEDESERARALARLRLLLARSPARGRNLRIEAAYFERVAERLAARSKAASRR
jgi:hypothetical protein